MNNLSLKSSLNEKNNELNVFISWHNRGPLSASDLLELGIDLNLIDESRRPRDRTSNCPRTRPFVRVHNNDVIIHHNKMISFGRLKKMFDYPSLDKQDENDFRSAHIRSSTSPARLITIITYIQKPTCTRFLTPYSLKFITIHKSLAHFYCGSV